MAKLPSKTLFTGTIDNLDVIHMVDVSDTTADPLGTSFKLTMAQVKTYVGVASFDKVAIFAASGTPTFYNTFALAYAASSVGDSIHVFADLTEDITIDKNLTVVGYGNTITGEFFITSGAFVTMDVLNLTLADAVNPTLAVDSSCTAILNGSTVTNTLGVSIQLVGSVVKGTSYGTINVTAAGLLQDHKAYTDNETLATITSLGALVNVYAKSTGGSLSNSNYAAINCTGGTCINSIGESEFGVGVILENDAILSKSSGIVFGVGSYGIYQLTGSTGKVIDCYASTAGVGFTIVAEYVYNSNAVSETGGGLLIGVEADNCTGHALLYGLGASNSGGEVTISNSTAITTDGAASRVSDSTHAIFTNCTLRALNLTGISSHGVLVVDSASVLTINNCTIITLSTLATSEGVDAGQFGTSVYATNNAFSTAGGVRYNINVSLQENRTQNAQGNREIL